MQWQSVWALFILLAAFAAPTDAMTRRHITELRRETIEMFYHGFDNYMTIAFPEDEACFFLNVVHFMLTLLTAKTNIMCATDSGSTKSEEFRAQRRSWQLFLDSNRQSLNSRNTRFCSA